MYGFVRWYSFFGLDLPVQYDQYLTNFSLLTKLIFI